MLYVCVVKHSEIKQTIIETASSLFYKNGYNSTGINEIIAKSSIAKATLYNHFKSKEDICLAYLQFKNSTFQKEIDAYCRSKATGKKQVLAIYDFLLMFFKNEDFNGCWCIKTVSEIPKENERVRNEIQDQKNSFIRLIQRLIEENIGGLSQNNITTKARQIYLLYEGAVIESQLHRQDWPIKEAKKLASIILN